MMHVGPLAAVFAVLCVLNANGARGSSSLTSTGLQLQQQLDAAIASNSPKFTLPPGSVSFARGERLVARGATNMRIVAAAGGTTLWFQPGGGLKIINSANVTLTGITIDYDPLPYVQAEIVAMQELGSDVEEAAVARTAEPASAAQPSSPQQKSIKYTLRLADRSPLFNYSCARPNDNQSSPWDNNASVCEHNGINQLFGSDRTPKIGSDFGDCPPLPASMCPMPSVPSVGAFEEVGNRTYTAIMSSMLDANGTSVAQIGDFLTYSGRDWYTYVLANSSNVTTAGMTIHSSTGFTIVELDGECGHTFQGVNVIRRDGYMIASNGDVFHSSDCATAATIEDSTFEASLDDFYNIHTTVHVATTALNDATSNADASPRVQQLYIVQPRETGTDESVGPEVLEDWYGTASPMSSMRPGDTLSCWEFNTIKPAANLTLKAWPEPITDKTMLAKAAALEATLNDKSGTNARMNRWVSLKLWRVSVDVVASPDKLPLAVMCDLDRFPNRGAVIRRNVFQHGGHPQVGGRIKSSGALVEGNTFLHNSVLNQEVSFLQSWMEGPTHVYDVTIRNNTFINCTAVNGGPLSAQPGSFFNFCRLPNCWNNTQSGNIAHH